MPDVLPIVRHLIACRDIQTNPDQPNQVTLVNVISSIRSLEQPPFPLLYRELCFFVQLTECRGSGDVALHIVHAESGEIAYASRTWRAALPTDPIVVVGLRFRIRNLEFPRAGLYWIEFWYNSHVLVQQPLVLR